MAKIEKIILDLIKDNVIGKEEIKEAKVIITWLKHGMEAAKKIDEQSVKNLIKCGHTEGNLLRVSNDPIETIDFSLLILGAKGFVQCVEDKGGD